jgi:hypothetical protein
VWASVFLAGMMKAASRSIDLTRTAKADAMDVDGAEEVDEAAAYEKEMQEDSKGRRRPETWSEDGPFKQKMVRKLVRGFSSLVSWEPSPEAVADHMGKFRESDKAYTKLMNASAFVGQCNE